MSVSRATAWSNCSPFPQARDCPHTNDSVDEAAGYLTGSERYRRCQSLVDVRDDHLFQRLVEDLAEHDLDMPPAVPFHVGTASAHIPPPGSERMDATTDQTGDAAEGQGNQVILIRSRSLPGEKEQRRKRDHVSAWFVTREIVQGEKRYARLLAKAVSVSVGCFFGS